MTAKLVRALALLLPLTLDRSARAGEVLSVVAELPVIGRPDSLRFLRLGRGSALSLVARRQGLRADGLAAGRLASRLR